jgi:hypothetical protein
VYISWQADDGFMLERYSEQDENLLQMPPQDIGDDAPAAAEENAAVAEGNEAAAESSADGENAAQ